MADAIDQAQDLAAALTDDALKRHSARRKVAGLSHCENLECRQEIHPLRQAHGAVLCIDCQRDSELEQGRHARRNPG